MCARTGWTWDYVWRSLDVPRINALLEHWQLEPPVGVLFASFAGFKRPQRKRAVTDADRRRQAEELLGLFGVKAPDEPPPPIDLEAKRREIRERHAKRRQNG